MSKSQSRSLRLINSIPAVREGLPRRHRSPRRLLGGGGARRARLGRLLPDGGPRGDLGPRRGGARATASGDVAAGGGRDVDAALRDKAGRRR